MKYKMVLLLTLLALFIVVFTWPSVGDVRAAPRGVQSAPDQEGTCAPYGITFDADSIETLYVAPDTVLAAPETFYETDPAYKLLTAGSGSRDLDKWKRKVIKLASLPPERRAEGEPLRFARELVADQETFCEVAVPHVLSYLPEGADLQGTTVYLTALEHPFPGASRNRYIVLPLSHPYYHLAELLFGQGGSSARNGLAHELVHRGYGKSRALRTELTWEDGPLQELIDKLHDEGMATYVAYTLRSLYPSPLETENLRLENELGVRLSIARLNRIFKRADSMDLARLWSKVGRFCSGRREAYVVGAYMARRIEEQLGKGALVATVAQGPASFIRTYNTVAKPGMSLAYQPPPVPEGGLYLELREAALAGDAAAVETRLAAIEAAGGKPHIYEGYLLYTTGQLLLQQGHLEQATRAFEWFVASKPELAVGHLGLGECYQAAGQDDLARAAYEEGLKLNPRAAWAAVAIQELE